MVTSNKVPEKKIVKMAAQNNVSVIPQRTLLGEVNEQITCPLCQGYYIDATTIVECLHSFCRSCIIKHLQVKSYCPVCEMMINSAKPNIKLDKALQDIVYKLVPGLFQKEMERRQQFYASRPGPAASATPEQRGEDTERIIFSPEDVISFSLEYADMTDTDSISSKSSDSNDPQPTTAATRRFLQCPAVVNISHLKKFLSMKFDIDSTQFAIDILYKRVPLPDYYTLMDIAYIYNWKRNEPMRFFYQIIDYIAIRNRFFDINRKDSHFQDRKSSPTTTEDTNVGSPAPNLHDQASESSSGAESPMPDDNSLKQTDEISKTPDKNIQSVSKDASNQESVCVTKPTNVLVSKKNDEDVEKSQFLNSFELTAKNSNTTHTKSSPNKAKNVDEPAQNSKASLSAAKIEESLKRKQHASSTTPELKKLKIELERSKVLTVSSKKPNETSSSQNVKTPEQITSNIKNEEHLKSNQTTTTASSIASTSTPSKEIKQQISSIRASDNSNIKRVVPGVHNNVNSNSTKRKPAVDISATAASTSVAQSQKTVSPLKLQIPKLDTTNSKGTEIQKGTTKKMPDLKPSSLVTHTPQNKMQTVNKVRMDLLANNSDPTMDRSKILSQVKTSMGTQNIHQNSGDSLKSIFDSCNINIPSSLSITLTDQKLDPRNATDVVTTDQKKHNVVNKNLAVASSNPSHKVPSPPVHNYIEILKLPDADVKKVNKNDSNSEIKALLSKSDSNVPQAKNVKASETSAKGPIPNLKPISDTKLGKQAGNFSSPITFQQTFEQQLQSMQTDKKPKVQKAKTQVPKLVPAQKVFNVGNKSSVISNKPSASNILPEPKPSSALDLSTAHNMPSQVGTQQNFDKALETMQSIANLAKKQNLPSKGLPMTMPQSSTFSGVTNRPLNTSVSSLKVPSTNNANQIKKDKTNTPHTNIGRPDIPKNIPLKPGGNSGTNMSSNYTLSPHNPNTAQPSPRSQTRSPSCSPKLVIAEDKQSSSVEQNLNQLNPSVSGQLPNINTSKSDTPKMSPGLSKPGHKPLKPQTSAAKVPGGIRQPMTVNNPVMNTSPDYLSRPQLISTPRHLLSQMDVNAWLKLQRQFNFDFIKSMSNMAHQTQNDYNNKDKQQ